MSPEFLLSGALGYNTTSLFSGAKEGDPGIVSLEWDSSILNANIHIHHWLIFFILLIIYITNFQCDANKKIITGFLLGGIIQGLSYNDWNEFIKPISP